MTRAVTLTLIAVTMLLSSAILTTVTQPSTASAGERVTLKRWTRQVDRRCRSGPATPARLQRQLIDAVYKRSPSPARRARSIERANRALRTQLSDRGLPTRPLARRRALHALRPLKQGRRKLSALARAVEGRRDDSAEALLQQAGLRFLTGLARLRDLGASHCR